MFPEIIRSAVSDGVATENTKPISAKLDGASLKSHPTDLPNSGSVPIGATAAAIFSAKRSFGRNRLAGSKVRPASKTHGFQYVTTENRGVPVMRGFMGVRAEALESDSPSLNARSTSSLRLAQLPHPGKPPARYVFGCTLSDLTRA